MEHIIRFKETMWGQVVKKISQYAKEGYYLQKVDINSTLIYGDNEANHLHQVFEIEMIRFENENENE